MPSSKRIQRRGQRGNALLMGVLMFTLALALFALITDVGLLYKARSELESYAQEVARAGATAVDLQGAFPGSNQPLHLVQPLAIQRATQFWNSLQSSLGGSKSGYTLVILPIVFDPTLNADKITVQITHDQPVYLIAAFVPIHQVTITVQASAIPQVGF